MIPLVEIGNSVIKTAVFDPAASQAGLQEVQRSYYRQGDLDELLRGRFVDRGKDTKVWLSSVADADLTARVCDILRADGHSEIVEIKTTASCLGVTNSYQQPERLGVDRWLNMIAVHNGLSEPGHSIIVDAGTAVTIDVLDAHGVHRGGYILPGIAMMRQALLDNTKLDFDKNLTCDSVELATSTENSVTRGTLYSIVATVDRVVNNTKNTLNNNNKLNRAITGGDAETVAGFLAEPFSIDVDLTLKGLLATALS